MLTYPKNLLFETKTKVNLRLNKYAIRRSW